MEWGVNYTTLHSAAIRGIDVRGEGDDIQGSRQEYDKAETEETGLVEKRENRKRESKRE